MQLLEFIQAVIVLCGEYDEGNTIDSVLDTKDDLIIELPIGTDYRIFQYLDVAPMDVVGTYSGQGYTYVPDPPEAALDGKSLALIDAEASVNALKKCFNHVELYCMDSNTPFVIIASTATKPKTFDLDLNSFTLSESACANANYNPEESNPVFEGIVIVKRQFVRSYLLHILRLHALSLIGGDKLPKVRFYSRKPSYLQE